MPNYVLLEFFLFSMREFLYSRKIKTHWCILSSWSSSALAHTRESEALTRFVFHFRKWMDKQNEWVSDGRGQKKKALEVIYCNRMCLDGYFEMHFSTQSWRKSRFSIPWLYVAVKYTTEMRVKRHQTWWTCWWFRLVQRFNSIKNASIMSTFFLLLFSFMCCCCNCKKIIILLCDVWEYFFAIYDIGNVRICNDNHYKNKQSIWKVILQCENYQSSTMTNIIHVIIFFLFLVCRHQSVC